MGPLMGPPVHPLRASRGCCERWGPKTPSPKTPPVLWDPLGTPHGTPYRNVRSVSYGTPPAAHGAPAGSPAVSPIGPSYGTPYGTPSTPWTPHRNTSSVPYGTPLWDPHGTPYGTPYAPTEGIQRVLREVGAETPSLKTPPVLWDPQGTPQPPMEHPIGTPGVSPMGPSYETPPMGPPR